MESLLNEIQLSEKIHVSLACLRRWRLRGEGPQYVKVGPLVRYPLLPSARPASSAVSGRGPGAFPLSQDAQLS